MKKTLRIIALVLMGVMSFGLVACGGDDGSSNSGSLTSPGMR